MNRVLGNRLAAGADAAVPVSVNRPAPRVSMPDVSDLWHRRELLYFLTWRDVRVRYKQTLLGASWAVVQPVAAMVVFTLVFGHVAGLTSHGFPYSVFVYTALVPWTFFSGATSSVASSLITYAPLLQKVYFPRLILPLSEAATKFVDLLIVFILLGMIMACFGFAPQAGAIVMVPVATLIANQSPSWRAFLDQVVALGYKLVITEMDVRDDGVTGTTAQRDQAIADYARGYLDLMFSYGELRDVPYGATATTPR